MVVDTIERGVLNRQMTLSVFLDIQGAFDNVDPKAAIKAMRKRNFPEKIINWYSNYLLNRVAVCDIKGVIKERKLVLGTPQGGILSPLIWNLIYLKNLNMVMF